MPLDPEPSLKQLRALEAVARLGSFTLAARELGVSQPTVSNLVYAIERQTGVKLLRRQGSDVTPTDTYESIRAQTKALLTLKSEIDFLLEHRTNLKTGTFWIGYSTYQIAMPLISEFIRRNPHVRVTARAMASHDLLPLLHAGQLDMGFITARECPDDVEGIEIASFRIGAILPEDHPLAQSSRLTWADMKGFKLIQREPNSATRRLFESGAQVAGYTPQTILGLGSWGSIITAVREGIGAGIGFEPEFSGERGLRFIAIDDPNLRASQFLVCLPAMRQTSLVKAMFAIAAEAPDGSS